jgi:hypothetical protein
MVMLLQSWLLTLACHLHRATADVRDLAIIGCLPVAEQHLFRSHSYE